jgi:hypothetical protein
MRKMVQYVPYIRTAEGHIERVAHAIFKTTGESRDPYVHEESLVGWPESTVFWAKAAGPSLGIAPFNF